MGVGTLIRRRNSQSGVPVQGTMEVFEFKRNRAFGVVIHDGPTEIHGWETFEAEGNERTKPTISMELPGMDETMDTILLNSRLNRSAENIKRLIEADTSV